MVSEWISSVAKIWDFFLLVPLFLFNTEIVNLYIVSMPFFQEANDMISIVSIDSINSYGGKTTCNYIFRDIGQI